MRKRGDMRHALPKCWQRFALRYKYCIEIHTIESDVLSFVVKVRIASQQKGGSAPLLFTVYQQKDTIFK